MKRLSKTEAELKKALLMKKSVYTDSFILMLFSIYLCEKIHLLFSMIFRNRSILRNHCSAQFLGGWDKQCLELAIKVKLSHAEMNCNCVAERTVCFTNRINVIRSTFNI